MNAPSNPVPLEKKTACGDTSSAAFASPGHPQMKPMPRKPPMPVIGWREWIALPDLGIDSLKAKVDTGARSSSLHAYDIRGFKRRGISWVRFRVHPVQRNHRITVEAEARVIGKRKVRTSSGHDSLRWVIETDALLGGERWPIEITLTRRDAMGFRMLLGRQALRSRFLVDPGRSFIFGKL